MAKNNKKFIIIDGNALLHRAWHALPPLTTRDGKMVNAVFGFASIMLNIIKELKPDYGVVAFDPPGKTFRHEVFKEYKATRQKQPDELYEQIPMIKNVAEDFGFKIEEKKGYEADDVIGTMAEKAAEHDLKTIIVTGDMDALQLVDKDTVVYTIKRGINDTITYDIDAVKEKHGFGPEKVIEYKALAGDSSDNIPGVGGVGEKTTKELLENFDSIEEIYKYLEKGGDKIKETVAKKLIKDKEKALLSKDLATIKRDIKLPFKLKDLEVKPADEQDLLELFRKLEFRSLITRAQEVFGGYNARDAKGQASLFTSGESAEEEAFEIRKGYHLIDTKEKLAKLKKSLSNIKAFAYDTETDGLGAITANMLGLSLSWKPGEAYYITQEFAGELKDIFENPDAKKYGHNIKYDVEVLNKVGIMVQGIEFDSMIASYLLRPSGRGHSLDNLAFVEFRHQMVPISDLIGPRGKKQLTLSDVDLNRVADYAAEDADYTLRLVQKLEKQLKEEKLEKLFQDIEMPLVPVLVQMEENGVKIDAKFLQDMSKQVGADITKIEKKIYKLAGIEFNVASPIQLKEILFKKLNISTKGIGKTKTGFSTAAGQLEKMKDEHEIIPLIMEYRELSKLKNTYLDALPELVNKETGRVHASFNQTIASTGRLSSSDPNLQNIPIRTELGREIRKAFVPEKGNVLIGADYSQIELRVAADLSGDKNLIKIFKDRLDVHTSTAAFMHDIDESKVTPEIRRTAKEVNFGVLYGMGARGLSQRTGMSQQKSKEFIDKYFETFKGVADFIEENIALARTRGFVETKFGRRLQLQDINSGVQQVQAAAERLATNMPIQGTAADIMKMAMIEIHKGLRKISPESKMLMQVHDELVFEVPKKDEKKVSQFIQETMESVTELRVPIVAEANAGKNWQCCS
ncbi:DNA polymerase I [bacterium]|jgi:DNA polymerase-1|nr:DNA polymerase I [bacterium]MDP6571309.1 DNA polymerase I [Patescibacteria group bacterium]MDP6756337.1 DNA polymerase I [Patescibacteria group bacterium]|tara:strand:+ start:24013 stop:26751 length:2739 start_codon:yes stop_codon:yes gene_type:complete